MVSKIMDRRSLGMYYLCKKIFFIGELVRRSPSGRQWLPSGCQWVAKVVASGAKWSPSGCHGAVLVSRSVANIPLGRYCRRFAETRCYTDIIERSCRQLLSRPWRTALRLFPQLFGGPRSHLMMCDGRYLLSMGLLTRWIMRQGYR